MHVILSEGARAKTRAKGFYIHRLVAVAFVEGDHSLFVCHLDGSRTNNHFSNLKWATQKENMLHAREHGTMGPGEKAGSAKFCDAAVRAMVRMYEDGLVMEDIAYFFDCNAVTVWGYINGTSRATALIRKARE